MVKTMTANGHDQSVLEPDLYNLSAQKFQQIRQARQRECAERVQDILDEYGCNLVAIARLTPDGRIAAEVQLTDRQ